jgi:murein DD-endopeptidase MepM/ murein hydrolase activator NlpD
MAEVKKEKKRFNKLRNKYKLVLINEENFEQRFSLRLSRLNVYLTFILISLFWISIMVYLLAFTSLREYIPGYTDPDLRYEMFALEEKLDSLQHNMNMNEVYVENIRRVLSGSEFDDNMDTGVLYAENIDDIKNYRSREDSILRQELENMDQYNIYYHETEEVYDEQFSSGAKVYFAPITGVLTNAFDANNGHYGIDIVAKRNEAIKSIDDGMVVFAEWTLNTGYVIMIQHSSNVISVYKHNSSLLKKLGDYVKAGDLIAIIGNTGEQTSGPHLHFELWIDGSAVNPTSYISF